MVAELWLYPDGSRILELSTKCRPEEAFQIAAEARFYLSDRGIDLSGTQQTKTKATLEYMELLATCHVNDYAKGGEVLDLTEKETTQCYRSVVMATCL